ncbi:MAG: PhoH family protein [Finegoldia sp.]|nr:PhoH family protein [Finegoldia sp.]
MDIEYIYTSTNNELINLIFGELEKNLKKIEDSFNVKLFVDENGIKIIGSNSDIKAVVNVLDFISMLIDKNENIEEQNIDYIISNAGKSYASDIANLKDYVICYNSKGKPIHPKTISQKRYIDMIKTNDILFGLGPAGTGKTYLAMAMAVTAFRNNEIDRIILTRPAVEAGENLGFLPGDLQEKIDPYLRPLYDALFDILGYESYAKLVEKGLIEVAPLAYMRGRTLDNAFIILDEAQNTTNEQMKMFLTRIGYGSKAIVTGDTSQIDLPRGKKSGLIIASNILSDIEGIGFLEFGKEDVVRHPLVQRIIGAYEKFEKKNENDNRHR